MLVFQIGRDLKLINKYSIGIEIHNPGHQVMAIKILIKNKLNAIMNISH